MSAFLKSRLTVMGFLTVAVVACSSFDPDDVQRYIDPEIQGEGRRVIAEIMQNVPTGLRDSEVLFVDDDNTIYTNKVASQGRYAIESLPNFSAPDPITVSSTNCPYDPAGPFRRVMTQPGLPPGPATATARFAYASSDVALPSISDMKLNTQEIAFVYMGTNKPTAVDAGLSFNPDKSKLYWGPYFLSNNPKTLPRPVRQFTFPGGQGFYAPNTQVFLEFVVPIDNIAEIRYTGQRIGESTSRTTLLFYPARGLRADGKGNVMKRVTSIVTQTGRGYTRTGSFMRNVTWLSGRLAPADPFPSGGFVFGLHSWGQSGFDIDQAAGGDCATASTVTVTSFGSFADEIVDINLQ